MSHFELNFGAPTEGSQADHPGALLRNGKPARLAIEVRDRDVRLLSNNQLVLHWKGDLKWLTKSTEWQVPDDTVRDLGYRRVPFLGCCTPFTFSRMTATPLGKD